MGCGRLFEGSPEQMLNSLNQFKKLPSDTLIYSAHEYTEKNAFFAMSFDEKNPHLKKRYDEVKSLRKQNKATVPFYLEQELLTNPFLRTHDKQLKEALGFEEKEEELRVFTELRKRRDHF